ncbi:hypothetical protein FYC62_14990 [Pedobacter aquae]|uniref:Uncharacterized protein n=1 Tax=Pedobacter aquae TaxID=2605747 RepID=A0A5C0VPK3_9SPHI|nr:hypothetical protein [Pedobacter aquae]QEK52824.1 hypothetical protein FYC62_14990 [Pedobacter aquae]
MKPVQIFKYCEQEDYKLPDTADIDVIPLECINCILDDILSTSENIRKDWIKLYKDGNMQLQCRLTGKKHLITKEFFDKVKWD